MKSLSRGKVGFAGDSPNVARHASNGSWRFRSRLEHRRSDCAIRLAMSVRGAHAVSMNTPTIRLIVPLLCSLLFVAAGSSNAEDPKPKEAASPTATPTGKHKKGSNRGYFPVSVQTLKNPRRRRLPKKTPKRFVNTHSAPKAIGKKSDPSHLPRPLPLPKRSSPKLYHYRAGAFVDKGKRG